MDKIERMKKWWKNKGYTVEVDHYMCMGCLDPCFIVSKDGHFAYFDIFDDDSRNIARLREDFNWCWAMTREAIA